MQHFCNGLESAPGLYILSGNFTSLIAFRWIGFRLEEIQLSRRMSVNLSALVEHLSRNLDIKKLKIHHRNRSSSFSNTARCSAQTRSTLHFSNFYWQSNLSFISLEPFPSANLKYPESRQRLHMLQHAIQSIISSVLYSQRSNEKMLSFPHLFLNQNIWSELRDWWKTQAWLIRVCLLYPIESLGIM